MVNPIHSSDINKKKKKKINPALVPLQYLQDSTSLFLSSSPRSPERALVLPPVSDSDKYEALSVQLETLRLNGVSAIGLIKSLIDTVNKLCDDVAQLKSDNSALKIQVEGLQTSRQQPPGLLSPRPAANSGNSSSSGPLALAACK
jgi:hypothetical protein